MEEVTEAVMSVVPLAMVAGCMADTTAAGTVGVIIPPGIMAAGMGGGGILTGMADIHITLIMGMVAVFVLYQDTGKPAGILIRKVT